MTNFVQFFRNTLYIRWRRRTPDLLSRGHHSQPFAEILDTLAPEGATVPFGKICRSSSADAVGGGWFYPSIVYYAEVAHKNNKST